MPLAVLLENFLGPHPTEDKDGFAPPMIAAVGGPWTIASTAKGDLKRRYFGRAVSYSHALRIVCSAKIMATNTTPPTRALAPLHRKFSRYVSLRGVSMEFSVSAGQHFITCLPMTRPPFCCVAAASCLTFLCAKRGSGGGNPPSPW